MGVSIVEKGKLFSLGFGQLEQEWDWRGEVFDGNKWSLILL